MQIVHTDLDNTLIYSYKHEIGGPPNLCGNLSGKRNLFHDRDFPQTGNFKEKTENKIQNEEKKIFSDQILAYLLECLS